MRKVRLPLATACAVLVGLTVGAGNALADQILPGFDLFATVQETSVDFGDSGPGIGKVLFRGVPGIIPNTNGTNIDTVVARLNALPIPPGGLGIIDIRLEGLALTSVTPVNINGFFYNVDVRSGSLLGLPDNDLGKLTILSHDDAVGGGTFTSVLPVTAQVSFTSLTGGPPIPDMTLVEEGLVPVDKFGLPTVAEWSHTPSPLYPHIDIYPDGGFFAGVAPPGIGAPPGTPGTPTVIIEVSGLTGKGNEEKHSVEPATIPEPGSLVLLGLGGVGMIGYAWRRRKKTP